MTDDWGWISGRIGFEYPSSSVGVWDEQRKDYRSIRPAQVTRYVIDTKTRRVAFELKSSTIKPWTFQGNFQALLNEDSGYQWRVTLEGLTQPSWRSGRSPSVASRTSGSRWNGRILAIRARR